MHLSIMPRTTSHRRPIGNLRALVERLRRNKPVVRQGIIKQAIVLGGGMTPNALRFCCGGLRRPPPSQQTYSARGRRAQAPASSKRGLCRPARAPSVAATCGSLRLSPDLLHVIPQYGIHPGLVARSQAPEPSQHILVYPKRDGLLGSGAWDRATRPG